MSMFKVRCKHASIPGLAYGIVKDGQVVHLAAFGVTGPSGQPMTTRTPMQIGSVGKTMTALAIRQLINAGKIDLDAPVGRYIQEHIFDQLDMRHSYVSETAARQHGLAEGYRTENASTIADDVFRMYQGFPLARPAQPISTMFIVIDILVLLAISALVWHAMRLRSWGKRVSRARSHLHTWIPSVLTDGILPLCLLLGPPIVLTILGDAPRFAPVKDWEMLLLIAPDIGYTLLAIASILLVIGTVKLVWVSRQLALGQGSLRNVNQSQVY